ncbi:MAG: hypothetical protein K8L97_01565 [Anaerolineae bacterium]|nr:hypothetical protein [Anaerolineae bacterium]
MSERVPIGQALQRGADWEYTWWSDGTVTRCGIAWEAGQYHRVGLNETVTPEPIWNAAAFYAYREIAFKKPIAFLPRSTDGG